jgi:hypothetical protein
MEERACPTAALTRHAAADGEWWTRAQVPMLNVEKLWDEYSQVATRTVLAGDTRPCLHACPLHAIHVPLHVPVYTRYTSLYSSLSTRMRDTRGTRHAWTGKSTRRCGVGVDTAIQSAGTSSATTTTSSEVVAATLAPAYRGCRSCMPLLLLHCAGTRSGRRGALHRCAYARFQHAGRRMRTAIPWHGAQPYACAHSHSMAASASP